MDNQQSANGAHVPSKVFSIILRPGFPEWSIVDLDLERLFQGTPDIDCTEVANACEGMGLNFFRAHKTADFLKNSNEVWAPMLEFDGRRINVHDGRTRLSLFYGTYQYKRLRVAVLADQSEWFTAHFG